MSRRGPSPQAFGMRTRRGRSTWDYCRVGNLLQEFRGSGVGRVMGDTGSADPAAEMSPAGCLGKGEFCKSINSTYFLRA